MKALTGARLRRHVGISEVPEDSDGCKAPSSRGVTSDPEDFDGCTAPSSRGTLKFVMSSGHMVGCLLSVFLFSLPLFRNHELIFFSALHELP